MVFMKNILVMEKSSHCYLRTRVGTLFIAEHHFCGRTRISYTGHHDELDQPDSVSVFRGLWSDRHRMPSSSSCHHEWCQHMNELSVKGRNTLQIFPGERMISVLIIQEYVAFCSPHLSFL
jgi:hypothetical protein